MLPEAWGKSLVDMNVESLNDDDLRWADLVFASSMSVQKESVQREGPDIECAKRIITFTLRRTKDGVFSLRSTESIAVSEWVGLSN